MTARPQNAAATHLPQLLHVSVDLHIQHVLPQVRGKACNCAIGIHLQLFSILLLYCCSTCVRGGDAPLSLRPSPGDGSITAWMMSRRRALRMPGPDCLDMEKSVGQRVTCKAYQIVRFNILWMRLMGVHEHSRLLLATAGLGVPTEKAWFGGGIERISYHRLSHGNFVVTDTAESAAATFHDLNLLGTSSRIFCALCPQHATFSSHTIHMEGSQAAAGQQEQQEQQGQQVSTSSGERHASSSSPAAASQQQQLPPTHKPLTHNPPTSPKSTPWPSPATGSPFPQLARPDDSAMGVISSSGRADRMSPTAAPWVAVPPAAAGPPSSQLMTGRPVQGEHVCC